MDYAALAERALAGELLGREACRAVLASPDDEILDLLAAAYRVRRAHWGRQVQLHVLQNAKSGLCPEDCHYCSQSSLSQAKIDKYPYLEREQIVEAARRAHRAGAVRYCIVGSGRGPTPHEVDYVGDIVRTIKAEMRGWRSAPASGSWTSPRRGRSRPRASTGSTTTSTPASASRRRSSPPTPTPTDWAPCAPPAPRAGAVHGRHLRHG